MRLAAGPDRLTDLVGTLVDVTRAEGDPSATRLEPLRLSDLLREVVSDCHIMRTRADAPST